MGWRGSPVVMVRPLLKSRWSAARWIVVAPHADDETLGAGALIAHAAQQRRLVAILYLTDGRGSHPAGTPRLAMVRRSEACAALRRLGAGEVPIIWLDWRDAHPHAEDSACFARDARRLAQLCRARRVDAIAVSDEQDAHCDHVAAFQLVKAAARRAHGRLSLFAYHVWSERPRVGLGLATPAMAVGRRRQALCAHRSQLSARLGNGFRLPRDKQRMASADILVRKGIYS